MNSRIESKLVKGLQQLYGSNPAARRLFDNFAARQKDRRVTPASRAAVLADTSHTEVVALLRELDELGAGEFKLGRRGSKTRIEWLYSQRSLGEVARGAAAKPEDIEKVNPAELEESEGDITEADGVESDEQDEAWIAHDFQLRPDLRVALRLPADLTLREAERLAGFIRQIPFEG